jgi:two-component sensor histidine kinase
LTITAPPLRDQGLPKLCHQAQLFSRRCGAGSTNIKTVPFNVAMPLGVITAELFSNSLKYTRPTGLPAKISVSCKAIAEDGLTALRFEYEDDGVGFPEDFDISNDGNLGMRFIRSLSEQLQGTQNWTSDPLASVLSCRPL